MPDISMCMNEKCTKNTTCYRYAAIPNPFRQSYMHFEQDEDGDCDDYISMEENTVNVITETWNNER